MSRSVRILLLMVVTSVLLLASGCFFHRESVYEENVNTTRVIDERTVIK